MKLIINATGAAIIAAALATPAAAFTVEPGTYVFEAADGSQQKYTVAIDTNGDTAVTALSIGFTDPCKVTGTEPAFTLQSGWGFGGDYVIGTNGKVTIVTTGSYFAFDITLTFGKNGTATVGKITSYGVTLYPEVPNFIDHPTHSLFCVAPIQATAFQSFTPPTDEPAISAPNTAKFVKSAE